MHVSHPVVNHIDDRGIILDVLNEPVDAVTLISLKAGAERGGHYHKETVQWCYVLAGVIMAKTESGGEIKTMVLPQGDMIRHDPGEAHTLRGMDNAVVLIMTRGPRADDYESDTYRV